MGRRTNGPRVCQESLSWLSRSGIAPHLFPVLFGNWAVRHMRGESIVHLEQAKHILKLAKQQEQDVPRVCRAEARRRVISRSGRVRALRGVILIFRSVFIDQSSIVNWRSSSGWNPESRPFAFSTLFAGCWGFPTGLIARAGRRAGGGPSEPRQYDGHASFLLSRSRSAPGTSPSGRGTAIGCRQCRRIMILSVSALCRFSSRRIDAFAGTNERHPSV